MEEDQALLEQVLRWKGGYRTIGQVGAGTCHLT